MRRLSRSLLVAGWFGVGLSGNARTGHCFKNRLDQNRKLRIKRLWYTKSQITQLNVYRNGAKYLGIHPQRAPSNLFG